MHSTKQVGNLAEQALNDAKEYASKGEYEKALERHIWYHNHATEIDQRHSGVRLSFALLYWVELGKKYPKALEVLKKIRDDNTSRLLSGENNKELFNDTLAINENIGDSKATIELFKQLDNSMPDFAGSLYDMVNDVLVEFEMFDLARKYMGNPYKHLSAAKRKYQIAIDVQKSLKLDASYLGTDNRNFLKVHEFLKDKEMDALVRKSYDKVFTDRVIRIIRVLRKTGDIAMAEEIQIEALKFINSEVIRNAFTED